MSLISAFISHQIWLQRNATSEVNQLAPFIEEMRREVKKQVLAFGDESRTKAKLSAMLKDLTETLYALGSDWDEKLVADLQELAKYEAKWASDTMTDATGVNFTTPTPEQVWSAIKFQPLALEGKPVEFMQLVQGWKEAEVARLVQGVKSGFVQGQTTRQIVKQVVGAGGLGDVSERHAATVVRTALNHVSTEARLLTLQKNSDVVQKYEWISTLDSRTSTICRSRDGQKYEFGKGPLPPAHANCRSNIAPVVSPEFDFLDAGAKRAARGADGGMQIDANMSYYDFLALQPAAFQDAALGPVRGKIFRNAGMSPEEFRSASVDGFGRPLTLKEMAELDAKVAAYLKGGVY
jgi:SPP1 gp7 family putative phage head morphogenesis protein